MYSGRFIYGFAAALTAVAFAAAAPNAFAQSEGPYECIEGQYVMSASAPALSEKAHEAISEVTTDEMIVLEESNKNRLILLETKSTFTRAGKRGRSVFLDRKKDLCAKVDKKRRSDMQSMKKTGKYSVKTLRRFNCACNYVLRTTQNHPNDTYYPFLWGMNQASNIDIDAPEAWGLHTGNAEPVVAVIDTGIDYNHPDLRDNMWKNPGEIPGNGIDDDGNGYIDDVYGINAINGTGNPMDDNGHGTHCAGTIGGRGNNGAGVVGVSWNVKMIGVKFLSSSGSGSLYDALESIRYVNDLKQYKGINIVLSSNSWGGGGYFPDMYNEIERAKNLGILFVAAAGNAATNNDSQPSYPASYANSNVVAVASLASDGSLSSFSNYGAVSVDIAAPGSNIYSTYLNGGYANLSGTSMATPHVSGALALLASYAPHLGWQDLRNLLFTKGKILPSLSGKVATGRMLNVNNMLLAAYAPGQTPVPTPTMTSTPTPMPSSTPTLIPSPTPTMTPSPTPTPGWYAVSGFVRRSDNNAGIAGAKITFKSAQGGEYVSYSGTGGEYLVPNVLGPVTYSVTITGSGYAFSGTSVYVGSGTSANFTGMPSPYVLSGRVINIDKEPVSGVQVDINGISAAPVLTDQQGRFSFSVPIGLNYKITASKSGYTFNLSDLTGTIYGDVERTFVLKEY